MLRALAALGSAGPSPNGGNGVIRGTTRRRHAANQLLMLQNPPPQPASCATSPTRPGRRADWRERTRPTQPLQQHFREKTRPAQPLHWHFREKALRLTTFITTQQKATRKTPWIDDVCNNTHQSTPKTQHARPPMTPTGSSGPNCGTRGRWRGLTGLRDDAPSRRLAARTARGRAAAHGHTKQPGPTGGPSGARNTSGAQATSTHTKTPTRNRVGVSEPPVGIEPTTYSLRVNRSAD